MGWDIGAVIERPSQYEGEVQWDAICTMHIDRDYPLFGLMAGIRGYPSLFELRGFPDDASSMSRYELSDDSLTRSWLTSAEMAKIEEAYEEQYHGGDRLPVFAIMAVLPYARIVFWFGC